MNNVWALTKIYTKQLYSRVIFGKNKNMATGIVLLVFLFLLVEFSIGQSVYSFATTLSALGLEKYILIYGLCLSTIFGLIIFSYEMQTTFYKAKDYQLLASLPIKNSSIVIAKYLSSYISAFIYNLLFSLPTFIIFFIFNPISFLGILFSLIALFIMPFFVMFVGSIIAFVLTLITSKMKNKSIVSTIFMLVFFVCLSMCIGSSQNMISAFTGGDCPLLIKILLPQVYFIFHAVGSNNLLFFLFFILINALYMLLSVLVIVPSYKKFNSNFISSHAVNNKKPLIFKQESKMKSLIKKESKSFFGSSLWCTNCIVGPILTIVMAVAFGVVIIQMPELQDGVTSEQLNISTKLFMGLYLCIISVSAGLSVPTCSTFSMEGKKIQILKQLPLSFKQITYSKVLFNFILFMPFIYIANIIFLCFVPFNLAFAISTFVVPTISIFMFSLLGALLNLRFPKLDFINEAQVVKQSMSLFISMFTNLIISAIPIIFFTTFLEFFAANIAWLGLILASWFGLILLLIFVLFKKYGKKLYDKLY